MKTAFFHAQHEIFDGLSRFVPMLFSLYDTGRSHQKEVMRHEIVHDMLLQMVSSPSSPAQVPQTVQVNTRHDKKRFMLN